MENPFGKITTYKELAKYFHHNMSLMYGGFGGIGTPPSVIEFILELGIKDLYLIGNDTGFPNIGIGKLISHERAKKITVSHIGSNPIAGKLMNEGKLEIEFSPQGTLVERIRAGGVGLGGIVTDIGIENEQTKQGKQMVTINGKKYLVEQSLTAEVSIVYAKQSDPYGNLTYDKSARNTNPLVAMAGDITIAEVDEIVPLGSIHPEDVITPGVFIDYIVPTQGVNWKWVWQ
ncbi:CoA transferase subunit A [Caldibacillus lycopersici]|uniref:CoA transferase subunit A n=1 Tax=Perspicuibacillus lycopersici TaxID=1325689 RepID=A0AAE3IS56_9BACI|nr:CoA transferase subunit A [Perspicuibacillus lycopersici]MCU9613625.1 CoA transferase subunit A [Perspicuibacillus lycopersici]